MTGAPQCIRHLGGAHDVDVRMSRRLVQRLRRPGFGREVDHDIRARLL